MTFFLCKGPTGRQRPLTTGRSVVLQILQMASPPLYRGNEETIADYSSYCRCDSLPRQLWEIFLLSEGEMDYITLLGLDGNQLHLPVEGERKLFERAVTVLQKISKKVKICLHWEREKPDCHSLCETLLEALPYVSSLRYEAYVSVWWDASPLRPTNHVHIFSFQTSLEFI